MNFRESVANSWQIIVRNKIRSFLTMLGIIIGVMAVVVIMAVGAGAQSLIVNQVNSVGTNLLAILPGKSDDKGPPAMVFGIVITTLKDADGQALLNSGNPHILAYTSYVRGAGTMVAGSNSTDGTFVGVSGSYPEVEQVKLKNGRFFTVEEEKSTERVAILGGQIANDLFDGNDPIGKLIKIKKTNFLVIGILENRGSSGFQNQDTQVFVPLSTAQKLLLGIDHVSYIRAKVDDAAYVNDSMEYAREIIRARHDNLTPENDDFSVRSSNQSLDTILQITNALKFFLAAIAAISLLVGGIGIMNIMLAAVQERTREIGLRKAIGAKRYQITMQFLIETVMVTLIGGLVGIILGVLIAVAVAQIARGQGYMWDLTISANSIILGCTVSIIIGLIFGIIPARKAAQLNPIDALRYE